MRKVFFAIGLLIMALLTSPVSAVVHNIPDDYTTIQAGIDASSDGDTVLVHPGVYFESFSLNGKNITLSSLYLTTGNENYIDSTIIEGQDSVHTLISIDNGENDNCIVTGFTITGARLFDESYEDYAIYIANSNPTIESNTFDQNFYGIYCTENADPIITNNTFTFCYVGCKCNNQSNPIISSNFFNYNSCSAIRVDDNSTPVIENNTMTNNGGISWCTGGGISISESSPIITNNSIVNNASDGAINGYGGGIYCGINSSPLIIFNLIQGNETHYGGGIYCRRDSYASIYNNIIIDNIVASGGGGIYCKGNVDIRYNLIARNDGGIFLNCENDSCYSSLLSNTIYSNTSSGLTCNDSLTAIRNNIIRQNEVSTLSNSPITYSNIQGGWPGEGNIDCDPDFCYPDTNNFELADTSCCVGAGADSLGNPDYGMHIGAYGIGCGNLTNWDYTPGDANGDEYVIGSDVTFLVNYFRGDVIPPDSCWNPIVESWHFCAADANGDCRIIGSDVTFLVNYFRQQQPEIRWCPYTPPVEE